jgi:hypothetical protein
MTFRQFFESRNISYSALVLDNESHNILINSPEINRYLTDEFQIIAHHMTIKMGSLMGTEYQNRIGETETIYASHVGINTKGNVVAVKVNGTSYNKTPHVTIGVNRNAGGKPVMSNEIVDWVPLSRPIKLMGIVEEIS